MYKFNISIINLIIYDIFAYRGKRAAAKQRIERYYYQLKEGCGRDNCTNNNCASSQSFTYKDITNNDAGIRAIDLFKEQALLCDQQPLKVAKNTDNSGPSCSSNTTTDYQLLDTNKSDENVSASASGITTNIGDAQMSTGSLSPISSESMDCVASGSKEQHIEAGESAQNLSLARALASITTAVENHATECMKY